MASRVVYLGWIVATVLTLELLHLYSPVLIPAPLEICFSILSLVQSGMLLRHTGYSLLRVLTATTIAAVIGLTIAWAAAFSSKIRKIINPLIALRYLPPIALLPVFFLTLGIDELSRLAFIAISILVYFLPASIDAVDEVPDNLIDTGFLIGATRRTVLVSIIVPASLPSAVRSLITIAGIGWNMLLIAESFNTRYGLGHAIFLARQRGDGSQVFALLILIFMLATCFDLAGRFLLRLIFPWDQRFRS